MAILTKSGRAAIAAAIKSQPLYLALGAGSPHWDTQFETTVTLEPDIPVTLYAPVEEISVTAADGALWVRDQDYRLDAAAGRFTWLGNAGEAATATVTVRYRTGRAAEETGAQALMAEIGRRLVEERHFVEPDPEGEIVVPTGRFRVVAGPSNHLFCGCASILGTRPAPRCASRRSLWAPSSSRTCRRAALCPPGGGDGPRHLAGPAARSPHRASRGHARDL